jgi:hypothetical protein
MWGSVAGKADRHRATWTQIEAGDWMAFWVEGGFRFAARVCGVLDSGPLADSVWEPDPVRGSYRYITFFDALVEISVTASEMSEALGYRPNYVYRGYLAPSPQAQQQFASRFGDVESFLRTAGHAYQTPYHDTRGLLGDLVGITIPTVTGRPNTIVELRGDDVLVATGRSPAGEPVPIAWVDEALTRLLRDGRVEISVGSLGHKSAFVGAVLLTLPGAAATSTRPPTVILGADVLGAATAHESDQTGVLGSQYRSAPVGQPRAGRDPFSVDPAVVERGLLGHALTQNALATAVESAGLEPRSSRLTEPSFDLAWERDGVAYVAEVKSITDLNEERQLRLGLGQVLRYRSLLRAQVPGKVQAVLVPERDPRDQSWQRLCDDLDVILTSPPGFRQLDF